MCTYQNQSLPLSGTGNLTQQSGTANLDLWHYTRFWGGILTPCVALDILDAFAQFTRT